MAVEPSISKKKDPVIELAKKRKIDEYTSRFRCPMGGFHIDGLDGETCGKCGERISYT